MSKPKTSRTERAGVAINARVPAEIRKRVRLAAIEADRPIGEVICEALDEWCTRHGKRRAA